MVTRARWIWSWGLPLITEIHSSPACSEKNGAEVIQVNISRWLPKHALLLTPFFLYFFKMNRSISLRWKYWPWIAVYLDPVARSNILAPWAIVIYQNQNNNLMTLGSIAGWHLARCRHKYGLSYGVRLLVVLKRIWQGAWLWKHTGWLCTKCRASLLQLKLLSARRRWSCRKGKGLLEHVI